MPTLPAFMGSQRVLPLLAGLAVLAAASGCAQRAGSKPTADKAPFVAFSTAPDPALAIPDALEQAAKSRRHVLLVFGADWCRDSRRMCHRLSVDPQLASIVATQYVKVLVNVGDRNGPLWDAEVVQRYDRPFEDRGIPALVVLDVWGNQLTDATNNPLRDSDHRHPRRVRAFLESWRPVLPP